MALYKMEAYDGVLGNVLRSGWAYRLEDKGGL